MTGIDDHLGSARLVGRPGLIEDVREAMTTSRLYGALVVAEAGLGKMALASAVLGANGTSRRPAWVSASPSLSSVPFGALAPYLASVAVTDMESMSAVVGALERRFAEYVDRPGTPPLLVIDDAHELDEQSVAVLAQLIAGGGVRALVLSRAHALPTDLLGLWSDGLLKRFDLEPLDRQEAEELCVAVLKGPVITSAAAVLHRVSGGNPMFLLALMGQYLRLRLLVERNGVWLLRGAPPSSDLRLTDLVRGRLSRRRPAEREVLETVSLAEPIPLSVLRQICDPESIDSMESANMITIAADQWHSVRPRHPLYGELVRQLVPASRSLSIRQRVVDLMDAAPTSAEALLRYVCWALDCGATVADVQLLQAAQVANRLYDVELAFRAASAIVDGGLQHAARIEIARAHYYRGNRASAVNALDGIIEEATSYRTAKEASLLLVQLLRQTDTTPGAAHEVVDAWADAVERIAADDHGPNAAWRVEESRLGYRVMRCHALIRQGRFAEAEARLPELMNDDRTVELRLTTLALMGELLTSTGRPESGRKLTDEAVALMYQHWGKYRQYFEFVMSRHLLALLAIGDWVQIRALLDEYFSRSSGGLIFYAGPLALMDGLLAIRQGRAKKGLDHLVAAVEGLHERDLMQVLPLAVGATAYTAALLGEEDLCLRYVDELAQVSYSGAEPLELMAHAYARAARALINGGEDAAAKLRQYTRRARSGGMVMIEKETLELRVRVGDLEAVPRLVELTDTFEGAESRLVNAYGRALAADDPERVLSVGDDADDAGYRLLAAECAGHALRLYRQADVSRKQNAVAQLLRRRRSLLEGASTPLLNGPDSATELTRREREIASLAAKGSSNRDMAIELSVSLRTVEGHLYRIFSKLGISRREDLSAAIPPPGSDPWSA